MAYKEFSKFKEGMLFLRIPAILQAKLAPSAVNPIIKIPKGADFAAMGH